MYEILGCLSLIKCCKSEKGEAIYAYSLNEQNFGYIKTKHFVCVCVCVGWKVGTLNV